LEVAEAAHIKAKIITLQKQVKADVITVESTLFYYPKNGTAAKKVQLLFDYKKYFGSDSAKSLLDGTRSTFKTAWSGTPSANVSSLELNFQNAEFGIVTLKSTINFKPTKEYLTSTIDAMYNGLWYKSKVSDLDFKAHKLSLHIYAHEVPSTLNEDDLYYLSSQSSTCCLVGRSTVHNQLSMKCKASGGISTFTEYTSAFHPQKLPAVPQIEFDKYGFGKISFTIDSAGNLDEVVSCNEEIEFAKNWCQFTAGDKPEDG
ncbi:hypothetical protein C0993_002763, partial [Termitomyces sp. T159_Od127]